MAIRSFLNTGRGGLKEWEQPARTFLYVYGPMGLSEQVFYIPTSSSGALIFKMAG